jgi:hydroxymethylglutaryl-CoA synthase
LVLFATESSIDQSKAAGLYVHRLLQLSSRCRVLELKQACYSATGAVLLALDWLKAHPDQKALILASDIARYGLGAAGEPSQGGGAVALVLSAAPKLIAFETGSGIYTEEAMDFWRPNYRDEALVDGKYSCELYLKALKESWLDYQAQTARQYADHDYFLFHIPIPRLAEKALQKLALVNQLPRPSEAEIEHALADSLKYSRTIGNCYTASLYLGLLSLLEHRHDLAGKRLGFYSYGSGCIGEFFSGHVLPGYQHYLFASQHQALLAAREDMSLAEYEAAYQYAYPKDGGYLELPRVQRGAFRLAEIKNHQRVYEAACH